MESKTLKLIFLHELTAITGLGNTVFHSAGVIFLD
jgi:hypothetical protein